MVKTKAPWIIISIGAILLLIGGGTYAYFTDVEATGTHTFTTTSLNLQVGTADPCSEQITVTGLSPGQSNAAVASWAVSNIGNAAGDLDIGISAIGNNENTINEVEAAGGDVTDGLSGGELGGNLKIALWMDTGGAGWGTGDYYLGYNGSVVSFRDGDAGLPSAAYATLNNFDSRNYADVQTGLGSGGIGTFKVAYDLPASTNNTVQTDICTFSISFMLDQHV